MKFPESFSAFFNNKKLFWMALLLLLGIILIIFSAASSQKADDSNDGSEETLEEYKARLEEELRELCSSVDGVGKCRVSVSFDRGAENTYKGSMLIESKPPRVLGVGVVCRGGDSAEVRAALTELLSALFNIGKNRISVLKLNS